MARRPLVAVPGRFSTSASALRYAAVVNARALLDAVLAAGGEPLTVVPHARGGRIDMGEVGRRLAFADAVLLPGGGDLAPATYGQAEPHDEVYGVDAEQDAFDLAVAAWALGEGVPLLAVCRGMQVVNVALDGTLEQHMAEPHRPVVHDVVVDPGTLLAGIVGASVSASCHHHQRVDSLGAGLRAVASCARGGVEAVELPDHEGFFLGVQWHTEDTAATNERQAAIFAALVAAAR